MTTDRTIDDIRRLAEHIGRPVQLMEVCGTHTMSAFQTGLRSLLPSNVSLLSGPGCPVCVTPVEYVDHAVAIANEPDTIVASFGDMIRVPGSVSSLEHERALNADVRIVYSPANALEIAKKNTDKTVVFLGIGFETTAPSVAWTLKMVKQTGGIPNYFVLCAHKTIPEAMDALLRGGKAHIDGFLCPGHVSVITGACVYKPICAKYHIPCVVAGFEFADMTETIKMLLQQIIDKRAETEIQYTRSVTEKGNIMAQRICGQVFEKCDTEWRGLGLIPNSGLRIKDEFSDHDADKKFDNINFPKSFDDKNCICGDILQGIKTPTDCSLFGKRCTPINPVGACMVSSEGTCAAYYKYRNRLQL